MNVAKLPSILLTPFRSCQLSPRRFRGRYFWRLLFFCSRSVQFYFVDPPPGVFLKADRFKAGTSFLTVVIDLVDILTSKSLILVAIDRNNSQLGKWKLSVDLYG